MSVTIRTADDRFAPEAQAALHRPRLGFVGVGWIGLHRLKAILESGVAEVAGLADFDAGTTMRAVEAIGAGRAARTLEDLLQMDLDGVVIATPTALHAEQTIAALRAGLAVFCQKPLGRTAAETQSVVAAARSANRLLAVDMSYRFVQGVRQMKQLAETNAIGNIYAADLMFHNAYGPDKHWYYERRLSGGGCVMDLAIHLVDLLLWMLDFPEVEKLSSRLFAAGKRLAPGDDRLEDYATAQLDMAGGATANIACSWRLPAGCDAIIGAVFYGTEGGLSLRNVGGSFYDFRAERFSGTSTTVLAEPPDAWGGRAAIAWARQLAESSDFDPAIESSIRVAKVLDRIYAGC